MRKNWWKWLAAILVFYALIGGLFTPLKTGITGVSIENGNSLETISGHAVTLKIDIYNPGHAIDVNKVILVRDTFVFESEKNLWDPQGSILSTFMPVFGMNKAQSDGLYSVYVSANDQWMAFPYAISLRRDVSDTSGKAGFVKLSAVVESNPDLMHGFPNRPILNESIRNLLYHVPMWFSMIFVLAFAAFYSIRYLSKGKIDDDLRSDALIRTGLLAGILGCITGSSWASVTWDRWWPQDPKLNGVAIGMVMYLAYLLLRAGIRDEHQKGRVSAVYNLFVYPIFIALIVIMPKISGESLHPGAGGTVTFKQYDLDNTLRMYFYPAVAGWIMIFTWMASLLYRVNKLEYLHEEKEF